MKVKEFVSVWGSEYSVFLYDGGVFFCETTIDNVILSGDDYFGNRDVKNADVDCDGRIIITL